MTPSEPLRIVKGDSLEAGPPTPGMSRDTAFETDELWAGEVRAAGGVTSGWHHHGEHRTVGRVIAGSVRVEFGPGGGETLEAGPGDYFMVPPHTIHREGNPGTDEQVLAVVRVGTGPSVTNVDGPEAE